MTPKLTIRLVKEIKYNVKIDPALAARIRNIEHLKNSIYHDLNINATIDFYTKRYVEPLKKLIDIRECVSVDCASGYRWFLFAYIVEWGLIMCYKK